MLRISHYVKAGLELVKGSSHVRLPIGICHHIWLLYVFMSTIESRLLKSLSIFEYFPFNSVFLLYVLLDPSKYMLITAKSCTGPFTKI